MSVLSTLILLLYQYSSPAGNFFTEASFRDEIRFGTWFDSIIFCWIKWIELNWINSLIPVFLVSMPTNIWSVIVILYTGCPNKTLHENYWLPESHSSVMILIKFSLSVLFMNWVVNLCGKTVVWRIWDLMEIVSVHLEKRIKHLTKYRGPKLRLNS